MITKFKLIARLGLMHLVGTNICVWIRTLGKETLHVSRTKESVSLSFHNNAPSWAGIEKLIIPRRFRWFACQQQSREQRKCSAVERKFIRLSAGFDNGLNLAERQSVSLPVHCWVLLDCGRLSLHHVELWHWQALLDGLRGELPVVCLVPPSASGQSQYLLSYFESAKLSGTLQLSRLQQRFVFLLVLVFTCPLTRPAASRWPAHCSSARLPQFADTSRTFN